MRTFQVEIIIGKSESHTQRERGREGRRKGKRFFFFLRMVMRMTLRREEDSITLLGCSAKPLVSTQNTAATLCF